MAIDVQVSCIRKPDRQNPYTRIQGIGGVNPDGRNWFLTEADAIAGMDRGEWTFFVIVNGRRVRVITEQGPNGRFLKTEADGYGPNNLLSLPECPY